MNCLIVFLAVAVVALAANGGVSSYDASSDEMDAVIEATPSQLKISDKSEEHFKVKEEVGAATLEQPSNPLSLKRLQLEKLLRMPKLDGITKILKRFDAASGPSSASALKSLDQLKTDADKQIDKRTQESTKRLRKVKDADKKKKLEEKLKTEVETAKKSIDKYITEQKGDLEKLVETVNGKDFIKNGLELMDKAQQNQTAAIEKLKLLSGQMLIDVQAKFTNVSKVIDEINSAQ